MGAELNIDGGDLGRDESIIYFAHEGNLKGLKNCLKRDWTSINNTEESTGRTAAHITARNGLFACTDFLLRSKGLNLHVLDANGKTILDSAIEGKNPEVLDLVGRRFFPNATKDFE